MPLMWQASPLLMQWCLDCHRNLEANLRTRNQIYNMEWKPAPNQLELGRQLVKEYRIRSVAELTNCSTCHR